jgi:ribosomal protein S18 acetylase RimI-like enzyme
MEVNYINLKIEKATKEDIPDIVKVHKECILKTNSKVYPKSTIVEWLEQISEQKVLDQFDKTTWLTLKKEAGLIGFCQYDINNGELYQIQISPNYQEKGYGKYFYTFIERDFIKNDKYKMSLFATLNSVGFYESVGFKRVENIKFPLKTGSIEMLKMSKDMKD